MKGYRNHPVRDVGEVYISSMRERKYLWVDDEREPPSYEYTHVATSATKAIALLELHDFDEVSFDHDLGNDEDGTGYDVLCWLEQKAQADPSWPIPVLRVHTENPAGRQRMVLAVASIERLRGLRAQLRYDERGYLIPEELRELRVRLKTTGLRRPDYERMRHLEALQRSGST